MNTPDAPLAPLTMLIYAVADENPPHFPLGSRVIVNCDCREGGCLVTGRRAGGTIDRALVAWEALEHATGSRRSVDRVIAGMCVLGIARLLGVL